MSHRAWETFVRGLTRTFIVYSLVDPRDGLPRYIGCTSNLRGRLQAHKSAIQQSNPNKRRNAWVRELRDAGLRFEVRILRRVVGMADAAIIEQRLVTRGFERGWPLFNRKTTASGLARIAIAMRAARVAA